MSEAAAGSLFAFGVGFLFDGFAPMDLLGGTSSVLR